MDGIALNTAGVSLSYAIEVTAGTRPVGGYTKIDDIKSTPDLNPSPETLETTTLSATEYKTFIQGLKDLGGAIEFTANLTSKLMGTWETLVSDYEDAKEDNKKVWFVIQHPSLTKAVYFTGEPAKIGLPSTEVNGVLESTLFITPTNAPEWLAKPTV